MVLKLWIVRKQVLVYLRANILSTWSKEDLGENARHMTNRQEVGQAIKFTNQANILTDGRKNGGQQLTIVQEARYRLNTGPFEAIPPRFIPIHVPAKSRIGQRLVHFHADQFSA